MYGHQLTEFIPNGFQVSRYGIVVLLKQYQLFCLLCLYLSRLHDWCLPVDFGLKLAVDVNYAFSLAPQALTLAVLFGETLSQPR
jgi:hypothetical protein